MGTTVRDDCPKLMTPVKVRMTHCPGLSVSPFWSPLFPSPLTGAICPGAHDVATDVDVLEVVEELDVDVELEVELDVVLEVVAGRTGAKTTSFTPLPHPWSPWPRPPLSPSPGLEVLVWEVDVACEELDSECEELDVDVDVLLEAVEVVVLLDLLVVVPLQA